MRSQPFRTPGGCLFWAHFNGSSSVWELHFPLYYLSTSQDSIFYWSHVFLLSAEAAFSHTQLLGGLFRSGSLWRSESFLLVLFKLYVKGLPSLGYYGPSRIRRTSLWEGRKNFKKGPRHRNLRKGTLPWKRWRKKSHNSSCIAGKKQMRGGRRKAPENSETWQII